MEPSILETIRTMALSMGAAVSLEIPRIVVSLEIPVFRIFSRKKCGKIVNICFLDSRDQANFLNFLWFFYMTSISYINRYFLAPSPLKPLKSSPWYQNLPRESVTAHSDHRGPLSDPIYPPKRICFYLVPPFWTFLRLMRPYLKWSWVMLLELTWS